MAMAWLAGQIPSIQSREGCKCLPFHDGSLPVAPGSTSWANKPCLLISDEAITTLESECLGECNDGLVDSTLYAEQEHALYWSDHACSSLALADERTSRERPEQVGSFPFA